MAHVFTMSSDFKKGYDAWIAQQQRQKKRMPPAAHALLSQWVAAGRTDAPLPGATFDAIITYLATGERQRIACRWRSLTTPATRNTSWIQLRDLRRGSPPWTWRGRFWPGVWTWRERTGRKSKERPLFFK